VGYRELVKTRIVVLGAGFAGLEFCTLVSEALGDVVEVKLIDEAEAFVFGFSKLDVMFGHATPESVRLPYRDFVKPGVQLLRETIIEIDPGARRVTTDRGTHQADVLVVALGADYDWAATPGMVAGRDEFYSVAGAEHLRTVLPSFTRGEAIVGVCGAPYKCPPAPSEAVLMLHDYLTERGLRSACGVSLVNPLPSPVPPSPETSRALVAAFAERDIGYLPGHRIASVDHARKVAVLDNGTELPCNLFLGVPRHCVPPVVASSGLVENGWVAVNPRTLATKFPGVYGVGDVTFTGTPRAGVFAEGAAREVAQTLIARAGRGDPPTGYPGQGSCYIEFGRDEIGRVDVDFFSGPSPTGTYHAPSIALRAEKNQFGSSRRARWFNYA
jgi:sulfide:quinone oxidoreductase